MAANKSQRSARSRLTTVLGHERGHASAAHPPDGEVLRTIDALEGAYRFRPRAEVRGFLTDHPDLLDPLVQALSKVAQFLPTDEQIVLETLWDPEDDGSGIQLYVVVPTRLDPEVILPRLEQLRREWWIDAARRSGNRLNIGVEYR